MFSSLMCAAMLGTAATTHLPAWQLDYRQGLETAIHNHKPLVVVLGSGPAAWDKVVAGDLSPETAHTLRTHFVCVYVDTQTVEGKKLADEFEMTTTPGVVMSDRTGRVQAYRHGGTLAEADLHRTVAKIADPSFVAQTTEANPAAALKSAPPAPVYVSPAASNCPSCQQRQSFYR